MAPRTALDSRQRVYTNALRAKKRISMAVIARSSRQTVADLACAVLFPAEEITHSVLTVWTLRSKPCSACMMACRSGTIKTGSLGGQKCNRHRPKWSRQGRATDHHQSTLSHSQRVFCQTQEPYLSQQVGLKENNIRALKKRSAKGSCGRTPDCGMYREHEPCTVNKVFLCQSARARTRRCKTSIPIPATSEPHVERSH